MIGFGVSSHGWTSVHLKKPRLKFAIKQNIKTIEFKRVVSVGSHDLLQGFQSFDGNFLNFIKSVIDLLFTIF